MSPKIHRAIFLCFCNFFADKALAVTLTSGQTNYTTTSDITSSAIAISSSLSGTSSSYNKIKNTFTITTNTNSGAYGIRTSGSYNQITNDSNAAIITTASSGRGISIASNSQVYNLGSIATQGTTSYGIYVGSGNNTINNSGSITTSNTSAYGIYLASDNNTATNSGTINTQVYGIYSDSNTNQIYNSGTITTTVSSSAHGIFMSAGSGSTASPSSYGIINNSGAINSQGHGIYNKDNYTQITNSGTITTAATSTIYGIRNEGDNVTITNSGTISATNYGIYNSGAAAIINNYGTISGGVEIGAATLNILGGSISGTVDGNENTGSVVIGDNVSFAQSAKFSALKNLTISSNATLNSGAQITANNIFLGANSTLNINSGSSISGILQGSSDSQGTVNIYAESISFSSAIASDTNSLANFYVDSDSTFTTSGDIYADQINLAGVLNFDQTNNSTINGNVVGSGGATLNVGEQNQKITGNLTLNNGDTFQITLKSGGAGSLQVSGSAVIDANAKIAITTSANQDYIADNTSYQILTASNLSTANSEFSTQNITINETSSNISGLLEFTVSASNTSLTLNVNHLAPAQVTSNRNAQNIYQNLVAIGAASQGELLSFQKYIDSTSLSKSELAQTINQLAPQLTKAAIFSVNNFVNSATQIVENRLDTKRRDESKLSEGVWGQVFGAAASQQEVASDDGYKNSLAGFSFGADYEIAPDQTIGMALAAAKSAVKTLDSSKQNLIDSYQLSFYGSKNFERYFFDVNAAFTLNHFDSQRSINAASSSAVASYLGQNYALKMKVGAVEKLVGGFSFIPEFGVNFLRNDIAGYTEKGAQELNLQVSRVSANFMEGRVGSNFVYAAKVHELPEIRKVSALLKFSYGYSFINDAPSTTANFINQTSSFDNEITNVERSSFMIGSELSLYHQDDVAFTLDYNFERKATYSSSFLAFKVRQQF